MTREEKAKQAQETAKRLEVAVWLEKTLAAKNGDSVVLRLRKNSKGESLLQIGAMKTSYHNDDSHDYFDEKVEINLPEGHPLIEQLLNLLETQ